MRKTPEECVTAVEDRVTFLRFLEALSEDYEAEREIEKTHPSGPYSRGALGWENGTIGAFLEAAAACGRAHLNICEVDPAENPWRAAAEIILAGKIYE